jgi:Ca2+/Na+ antiporter
MDGGTSSTSLIFVVIVIVVVIVFATTSSDKIKYPVLFYILSVIIVIMTTVSYLYRSERLVCAITVLILFILIFVFFGLRWLKHGLQSIGTYKGNYPAVVNTCPDYMSVHKNGTNIVCIDTVGIVPTSTTGLRTLTSGAIPNSENYFANTYSTGMSKEQITALKTAAIAKNLSWEGITDELYEKWTYT